MPPDIAYEGIKVSAGRDIFGVFGLSVDASQNTFRLRRSHRRQAIFAQKRLVGISGEMERPTTLPSQRSCQARVQST